MTGTLNENANGSHPPVKDAHGRAALLLVESFLHALIARKLLAIPDAVEIVAVASEVTEESSYDCCEDSGILANSLRLLESIGRSLAIDLPTESPT